MTDTRTHLGQLVKAVSCLLLLLSSGHACGPDFSPDVFVRSWRPDLPAKFVRGQLGLLQPGFPRADLLVAYRYLQGGALDVQEQKGWAPRYSEDEPAGAAQNEAQGSLDAQGAAAAD